VYCILNIFLKKSRNFVRKHSLTIELLIVKYQWQNISVAVTIISAVTGPEVTFADRTTLLRIGRVITVQLLTRRTPDHIALTLWPTNSPDLNLIDYRIWRKLQERVCTAGAFMTSPAKVASNRRVETFQPDNQLITDVAARQWRSCLRACSRAGGGYFEH